MILPFQELWRPLIFHYSNDPHEDIINLSRSKVVVTQYITDDIACFTTAVLVPHRNLCHIFGLPEHFWYQGDSANDAGLTGVPTARMLGPLRVLVIILLLKWKVRNIGSNTYIPKWGHSRRRCCKWSHQQTRKNRNRDFWTYKWGKSDGVDFPFYDIWITNQLC